MSMSRWRDPGGVDSLPRFSVVLLALVVVAGILVLAWACWGRPLLGPPARTTTYSLGTVRVGNWTFPVEADSLNWRICDTLRVDACKRLDYVESWEHQVGHPAQWVAMDEAGRIWRLSADDLHDLGGRPEAGRTYVLTRGHRRIFDAANNVWNVLAWEELR